MKFIYFLFIMFFSFLGFCVDDFPVDETHYFEENKVLRVRGDVTAEELKDLAIKYPDAEEIHFFPIEKPNIQNNEPEQTEEINNEPKPFNLLKKIGEFFSYINIFDISEMHSDRPERTRKKYDFEIVDTRVFINDDSLEALSAFTKLKFLNLDCCTLITDDGLKCLKNITSLVSVVLHCCSKITNKGLEQITAHPNIKVISVSLCNRISKKAITNLRINRPDLEISFDRE